MKASTVRRAALASINSMLARRALRRLPNNKFPSFIVVTPHLVHLAPLAAMNSGDRIQPVFVANGLDATDLAWLEAICPTVPVIPMRTSLRGNATSLLDHGVVIEVLSRVVSSDEYCFQDADCFVTDTSFWDTMRLDEQSEFAVGPFVRKTEGDRPEFPETFLVLLNGALLRRMRKEFDITAEASDKPSHRARSVMEAAGFADGRFLEMRKSYFDTLQQYWIAARQAGFVHRLIGGEGNTVHHIGGTSYLHRTYDDLSHWDYWPLNVHYFHLRLLEYGACEQFRKRFASLIEFHGNSTDLLEAYPDYAAGWRRRESDLILNKTDALDVYSGATR